MRRERGAALIVNGSAEMFFVTAGGKSTFRGRREMINNPYTVGYPGACPNVICVGGSNRRNMIMNINGEKASSSISLLPENDVISWSSAGPTLDGRQKPDVLAPGYNIISAMSSCMTQASVIEDVAKIGSSLIESWREDGRPVNMIAESGTSMSTPVVTGIIALWLQADPTLTPAKIKEVLAATSKHINEKVTYPNNTYGHGEINAYEGLLNILKINTVIPDLPRHRRHHPTARPLQRRLCREGWPSGLYPHQALSLGLYSDDVLKISPTVSRFIRFYQIRWYVECATIQCLRIKYGVVAFIGEGWGCWRQTCDTLKIATSVECSVVYD